MAFSKTLHHLQGVLIITSEKFIDNRGYFTELFKNDDFKSLGLPYEFSQQNLSYSKKNVIRGLHYQKGESAQGKLVTVLKGKVRDVFVDVREDSPTYGEYGSIDLSDENNTLAYIPPGFAHGFSVLSDDALFLYLCTRIYDKSSEGGILYSDPTLNIDWGIEQPIVSEKDSSLPLLHSK